MNMLTERQAKKRQEKKSRAKQEKDTWGESLTVHVTHRKINHPAMAP